MTQEKQTENATAATPDQPSRDAQSSSVADHRVRRTPRDSALPFCRLVLWLGIYAFSALFVISLILVRFRIQTIVIGAVLLACVALVIGTYALQWRR